MTAPIAWVMLEDAVHDWIEGATGIPGSDVYFLEQREVGLARPAPPAAEIETLTINTIGRAGETRIAQIMEQRYTVTADGPGTVGVLFYLGRSLAPQTISIIAGIGDPPATSAAALLVKLGTDLPTGVTAAADPEDTASVIVSGSESEPLYSATSADIAMLSVTTLLERFARVRAAWTRMTWRVTFRSAKTRGHDTAMALLAKAKMTLDRSLRPKLGAAGWLYKGALASSSAPTDGKKETAAIFDFALEGNATEAVQAIAMRATAQPVSAFTG